MEGRIYLAVPYEEREDARRLGARWDKDAKAWFAPDEGAFKNGLNRWPKREASDPTQAFGDLLRRYGFQLNGDPIMDGRYHRVAVEGDKGRETSGSYRGYLDGRAGGYLKNHRTGEDQRWRFNGMEATSSEARAQQAAIEADRQAARAKEEMEAYRAASVIAETVFGRSARAKSSNPYCVAKGITSPGADGLREVPAALGDDLAKQGVVVAGDISESKRIRRENPDLRIFLKGDLLIPAYDLDGKLWSVQSVNPNFKSLMKGGRKSGMHCMAGWPGHFMSSPVALDQNMPIVLCEGWATANTVTRALGHPVVVAFDAGNLLAVAKDIRERFPERAILIAGDNDHARAHEILSNGQPRGNRGVRDAQATAAEVRGAWFVPHFAPGETGSDWNDVAKAKGMPKARELLSHAVSQALERAREALASPAPAQTGREPRDARPARQADQDGERARGPSPALRRTMSGGSHER